jgi:hypothetical protein
MAIRSVDSPLNAFDRVRDAELAVVLNKTEFMIVRFYQKGHLTLQLGQLLFEMLKHPEFDIREVRLNAAVGVKRCCWRSTAVL